MGGSSLGWGIIVGPDLFSQGVYTLENSVYPRPTFVTQEPVVIEPERQDAQTAIDPNEVGNQTSINPNQWELLNNLS